MNADATQAATGPKETLGFQAEVKQLLKLMIHSLYSHKEIFLRELISNASDACDKLRFEALADPGLLKDDAELAITLECDESAGTITLTDNGIGMSRQDAIEHLGTIARSGTAEFLGRMTGDQKKDAQLIGQFGVGFYSSFIVADRVEVFTRRAGLPAGEGVHWESHGEGEFAVESRERLQRGTTIVLHLKSGEKELANEFRLKSLVRRYSDHIAFPVRMRTAAKADEVPGDAVFETINHAQALWTRPRGDIKDEEYREFYRHITHDFADPLAWTHNRVEGSKEYTSLLYVPGRAPFDLWQRDAARGLKLYVRRVFILDDAEQFLPSYLRFVKGIIDSADLPLNVSREMLQDDAAIESIRSAITRRVLDMLAKLATDDPGKYAGFWKEFGNCLKEGPVEDHGNRDRIAKLLRFATTQAVDAASEAQTVGLEEYIGRMQPGQEAIYYIIGDSLAAARSSPHLELLKKKGIEVLLLSDRVDEWLMDHFREFEGKKLRNVARGTLDLSAVQTEEEKETQKSLAGAHSALTGRLQKTLAAQVDAVLVTARLTDSPACLVLGEHDLGAQMRRILEAAGQKPPSSKPTLEINPGHPLLKRIAALEDGAEFDDLALLLFEQATLADGGQLPDPSAFVQRLNRLLLSLK